MEKKMENEMETGGGIKELQLSYYIIHHNGESNGKENGK